MYVLSLTSADTSKPLNVEENEKEYVVKAEIDPTAFMINSFIYKAKIKAIELKFLDSKKKNISLSDFVKKLYGIDDNKFNRLCGDVQKELERVHIKRASKIIANMITERKIESSLS